MPLILLLVFFGIPSKIPSYLAFIEKVDPETVPPVFCPCPSVLAYEGCAYLILSTFGMETGHGGC